MTTTYRLPRPLGPNDNPLLWGAFFLVLGAMLLGVVTGCGDEVEAAVHGGAYPRACPNACDDANPCTEDRCTIEGCLHDPIYGGPCVEPGLPSGTCWDGACVCVDAAGCDDGDDCTVDGCNGGKCGHEPITCES